jgi:polyhydroxybutyrate depolymerase
MNQLLKKKSVFNKPNTNKICSTSTFVKAVLITSIVLIGAYTWASGGAPTKQAYPLGPGDYERTIKVGGMDRYYLVHVPPRYNKSQPTPVVLNFHGGGGNPKAQRKSSQMDLTSDRAGFIAVYPQGTQSTASPKRFLRKRSRLKRKGFTWNAGTCCGWAQSNNIDDVGFTASLLDDLARQFNIDPKRVYATGYSNGAIMCYRLACELPDRIAAIAPVSGPMEMPNCNPSRPVSIIHFHGTKDQFAPFAGGKGRRSLPGQNFTSVEKTISRWLKVLKIMQKQSKIMKRGKAIGISYGPGKDGSEIVLWKLEGGGHTWPGGKFGILGKRVLGEMNTDISATELMWKFFQRHPMK